MGSCMSNQKLTQEEKRKIREASIRNKWIQENMRREEEKEQEVVKLLFLGAGESGKSTLLKQMTILHGKGFNEEDKLFYVQLIHKNILNSMKILCNESQRLEEEYGPDEGSKFKVKNLEDFKLCMEIKTETLTPAELQIIQRLWYDNGIRETYEMRHEFQLPDSAKYFFENIDKINNPQYIPNNEDILRSRIRTTGIVEHTFEMEKTVFRMFDVGGQRTARKKWIHCFQHVTSVIFVAALSGYNQKLFEDRETNRLKEALKLFQDVSQSRWFENTTMILFLNKKDLFKEGLKKFDITTCFPEYDGALDYRTSCRFVRSKFREVFGGKRTLFVHFTTAIDTNLMDNVFNDVRQIILKRQLVQLSLVAEDHSEKFLD